MSNYFLSFLLFKSLLCPLLKTYLISFILVNSSIILNSAFFIHRTSNLIVLSFLYLNSHRSLVLASVMFIIRLLLFVTFILLENKRINKKLEPISDLSLFKIN
jgi:hypothetical protein